MAPLPTSKAHISLGHSILLTRFHQGRFPSGSHTTRTYALYLSSQILPPQDTPTLRPLSLDHAHSYLLQHHCHSIMVSFSLWAGLMCVPVQSARWCEPVPNIAACQMVLACFRLLTEESLMFSVSSSEHKIPNSGILQTMDLMVQ